MSKTWNVLVVDDEPDIHSVTKLALRGKLWRDKGFELVSAHSAKEAQEILSKHEPQHFQVTLVDVVMENDHAGLDLCEWIRRTLPRSLRIVLRTGQPGAAPEEKVLTDYDIDHYLAKSEATVEKLFSILRASLRASMDIAAVLVIGKQLAGLSSTLFGVASARDMVQVMDEGLKFVENRFGVQLLFLSYIEPEQGGEQKSSRTSEWNEREGAPYQQAWKALQKAVVSRMPTEQWLPSTELELSDTQLAMVIPVLSTETTSGRHIEIPGTSWWTKVKSTFKGKSPGGHEEGQPVCSGLIAQFPGSKPTEKKIAELAADVKPFIDNWKIAFGALCLQSDIAERRANKELNLFQ